MRSAPVLLAVFSVLATLLASPAWAAPICDVSTTTLDFGEVVVGDTSQQSFTIENIGDGTLSGSVGALCAHYAIVAGSGSYALAAGESVLVTVEFAPAAAGNHLCTVSTGVDCASVSASGTGLAPAACELSTTSLDFGTVLIGESAQRSFTIRNTGEAALTGTVAESCPDYAITAGAGAYSIPGGDSLVVTVELTPSTSGVLPCTISTGTECADVSATGTGLAPAACELSTTSLDFGTVLIGESAQRSFTIRNTGEAALTGTVAESCPDYAITAGAGGYSIPGGDSLVVTVELTPSTSGVLPCTISTGTECADVSATGTGLAPAACELSTTSLDFGTVLVGESAQRTFAIRNVGGGTLNGAVTESCPDYTILAGAGAFAIPGGDSLVVTVELTPSTSGVLPCTISTGTECADVSATGTGLAPAACELSTTSLDFGTVLVGESAQRSFTIRNTGEAALTGTVAESCPDYAITAGAGGYSIPGGDSLVVTVELTPSTSGVLPCTISTGTECADVSATGTGLAPAACELSTTSLDFGTVTVGSAAQQTFAIRNTGEDTLTGTVAEACNHYAITAGAGPYSIPGGDSLVVTVTFSPTNPGVKQCTIETGTSCADVSCTGQGQPAPECELSTTSLDFGTVLIGESAQRTFAIRNVGGGTLNGAVTESCPDYTILAGAGAFAIPGGDSLVVTVELTPSTSGVLPCTISTGTECADVSATGTGLAPGACELSTTSLDFGTVLIGESAQRSFTIRNTGEAALTGTVAESCPDYAITAGAGGYSIPGGDSLVVTVELTPSTSGVLPCTISTGTECADVSATGTGLAPAACELSTTSLDFGTVLIGESAQRSFTIRNTGEAALTGTVAESCPDYAITAGAGGYSIPGGDSLVVTVELTPSTSGVLPCTISTGTECADVSATGTGLAPAACELSTTSLDFGTVTLGSASQRSFAIRNTGEDTLTGTVAEACNHYSITNGAGPYSIAGGDSLVVTVRFSPAAKGTHLCTISTGTDCADVSCTGIGEPAPACEVSATSLDFGTVIVGNAEQRSFAIRNIGGGTLNGAVTESCPDYSILAGAGPFAIAGGDSVVVLVEFTPAVEGPSPCTISTGVSCADVGATGTGLVPAACEMSTTSLDFGTVTVGSAAQQTFAIRNTGGSMLTGTVAETCPHYSITSGSGPYSIAGGDSLVVTVRFSPTAPGTHLCTISTGTDCANVSATGVGEPAPACEVSTTSLDFGTVTVGSAAQRSFTIRNTGGGTLTGSVSESCDHYSITSGGGVFSLAGGDSVRVTVRFSPTAVGTHVCTIDTGTSCADIACTGVGEPAPACEVTPPTLDFGTVTVGGSAQRSFTIRNTGGGTLNGAVTEPCADYTIIAGGGVFALAGGDSIVVTVEFSPSAAGASPCTIGTGTSCADVTCTGVGDPPPACQVTPTSLDFGTVTTGESVDRTFTIRNTGGGTLNGAVLELCSAYSIVSGGGVYALAGGDSVVVTVRFAPTTSGAQPCTVSTGVACSSVACTGVGELPPACEVSATSLDFGTVTVGESSTLSYAIRNVGGGVLTGSVVESCNHFAIAGGGGSFAIVGGDSIVVDVTYTPTVPGNHGCTIDNGTACADVVCSGTGENPPDCAVIPTTLDFGLVPVGTSAQRVVTIKNTGGGTLTGSVAESCPHYRIVGGGPYSLGPGDSTNVTVVFEPTVVGPLGCTVSTGGACSNITCTGEGQGPVCEISPTSITYDGVVTIGESAVETFTIENVGGGTLTGSVSEACADFSIVAGGGPYAIERGDSVVVEVAFAPTSPGTQQCAISTGAACDDVTFIGTGDLAPACEVTPATLDFGTLIVGQFVDRSFVIENVGGQTLTGQISETCTHFSILNGGGVYSLQSGQQRTVTVRYAPAVPGDDICFIQTGTACENVTAEGVAQPPPACGVSESVLDFGTVTIGEFAELTFDITNDGGGQLIGAVTESCDHFSLVAGAGSYSLGPGESRTVRVRYAPANAGNHACTIDTGPACDGVEATGRGQRPPECSLSAESLDFGTVTLGDAVQRTVTIENTGGGVLSGTVSETCADYTILSGGGPFALAAGESKVVTIELAPTTVGVIDCTIATGTACADIVCTGVGEEPPACAVTPTSIDFGTVTIGESVDRIFTIENTGGGQLTGSIIESCAPFSIVSGGGVFSLGSGESRTVTVRFTPTAVGSQGCTVQTGTACSNVALNGLGEEPPACELTTTSLDFGTIAVGSSSELSVTIENTGGGTLVDSVSIACEHYEIVSGDGPYALGPGQTQKVTVRFAPTAEGTHGCAIDMGGDCGQVSCTGVAKPPSECLVSVTTLSFGTVQLGGSRERGFSIRNTGGLTLEGEVSASCEHFEIVSGGGPYALGAGDSTLVVVRYTPTTGGQHTCVIETGTSCEGVTCTGTGEPLPSCSVTPASLDFGTVEVGDFVTRTFDIVNDGGGQLVGNVSEGCGDYEIISGAGGYALFANQTRSVTVRFSPDSPGQKTCLVLTGTECSPVACTGIGESPPDCVVTPTSLDFGTVALGSSATRSFTITNTGGGTVTGEVTETCGDFTLLAGAGPFVLGGGESKTVTVEFAPTTSGAQVCTIATGPDCPNVLASGVGGNLPACVVEPASLEFGTVSVGTSATRTFVIRNDGLGTLSGSVTASCTHFSVLTGGGSYSLAFGDSVRVTVRYAPSARGQHECLIETGSECDGVLATGFAEFPPEPVTVVVPPVGLSAYRLWSLPIAYMPDAPIAPRLDDLLQDVFGGDQDDWDGSTLVGSVWNDDPVLDLGRGFWIRSTRSVPQGYSLDGELQSSAVVPIETGWNIIGAPDTAGVDVGTVRVRDTNMTIWTPEEAVTFGLVSSALFDYSDASGNGVNDGAWVQTDVTGVETEISAWQGRLVYAYEPLEVLFGFSGSTPPPVVREVRPEATSKTAARAGAGTSWELTFAATSDGLVDRDVSVGVAPGASATWDPEDIPNPPLPPAPPGQGRGLSLAVDHRDWLDRAERYRRSIAGEGMSTYEWRMIVEGTGDQVTLTWSGMEEIPAELYVYVVLPDGLGVPIRELPMFTVATQAGTGTFRVLVGTEPYGGPVLDADPGGLTAIYPKPYSNDAMRIRYRVVSEAQSARLQAYDAQGRLVRDFGDVPRSVGEWEIRWDGRDQSGKPIGSGLYFIRLELDGRSFTLHQVVVR